MEANSLSSESDHRIHKNNLPATIDELAWLFEHTFSDLFDERDGLMSKTVGEQYFLSLAAAAHESSEPLDLSISMPSGLSRSDRQRYITLLRKEMALIRRQLNVSNRPIKNMHWFGDVGDLSTEEITQIMHYCARYFNLQNDPKRHYTARFDCYNCFEDKIDLLYGIGINSIEVTLSPLLSHHYIDLISYIRLHAFRHIAIRLLFENYHHLYQSMKPLLELLVNVKPDSFVLQCWCINTRMLGESDYLKLLNVLNQAEQLGYNIKAFNKGVLSKQKSVSNQLGLSIPPKQATESLGFGLGQRSHFHCISTKNYHRLTDYHSALVRDQLPIAKGRVFRPQDQYLNAVRWGIKNCLSINKKLLRQRYGLDFINCFPEYRQRLKAFFNEGLILEDELSLSIARKGQRYASLILAKLTNSKM